MKTRGRDFKVRSTACAEALIQVKVYVPKIKAGGWREVGKSCLLYTSDAADDYLEV